MRLAIVGSRTFNDYVLFVAELEKFIEQMNIKIDLIVSGGALGADSFARRYAEEHNIELMEILPDWNKYGRAAGFIRNTNIWDNSDIGIAFWDGQSKGTAHSFEIAERQNKILKVINYNLKEEIW